MKKNSKWNEKPKDDTFRVKLQKKPIEDEITDEQLIELQQKFFSFNDDPDYELTLSEFLTVFRDTFVHYNDDELRELFIRIDSNANNLIDWQEFSQYLLINMNGKRKLLDKNREICYSMNNLEVTYPASELHKDMISKIVLDPKRKLYFSAGRDGTIKVWNSRLKYIQTLHQSSAPITDMVLKDDLLVVTELNRQVSVYNICNLSLERVLFGKKKLVQGKSEYVAVSEIMPTKRSLTSVIETAQQRRLKYKSNPTGQSHPDLIPMTVLEHLDAIPMSVEYVSDGNIAYFGCDDGAIRMYSIPPKTNGFQKVTKPLHHTNSLFSELISCMEIMDEVQSIIVGSHDSSIKLFTLDNLRLIHSLMGNKHSVYSLSHSESLKILATCGRSTDILLWNPFFTNRPIEALQGHSTPVIDVAFNAQDYQLISLGTSKVIKIWDIRMYKCLQTIKEKRQFRPEDRLLTLAFDETTGQIITGDSQLYTYKVKKKFIDFRDQNIFHRYCIVAVLYNSEFNLAVIVDEHSVYTWSIDNGSLQFSFIVDEGIISASFDDLKRRIILSTPNGNIYIYNYYNGQLLKHLMNPGNQEINVSLHVSRPSQDFRHIYVGGWDRRIYSYLDEDGDLHEEVHLRTNEMPTPISALCFLAPDDLVVGMDDGSIGLIALSAESLRLKIPPASRRKRTFIYPIKEKKVLENNVTRCNSSEGKSEFYVQPTQIEDLRLLPSKNILVAIAGDGLISFYLPKTLVELYSFFASDKHESISCLDISLDENKIALGNSEGYVLIYDISDIVEMPDGVPISIDASNISFIRRFRTHSDAVSSLKFINVNNNHFIISGSVDCSAGIFTLDGDLVGYFGQKTSWSLGSPSTYKSTSLKEILQMIRKRKVTEPIDSDDDMEDDDMEDEFEEKKKLILRHRIYSSTDQYRNVKMFSIDSLERELNRVLNESIYEKTRTLETKYHYSSQKKKESNPTLNHKQSSSKFKRAVHDHLNPFRSHSFLPLETVSISQKPPDDLLQNFET